MGLPPGFRVRQELMDRQQLGRTLSRMAHEVAERDLDSGEPVIVGVRTRGVPLARRLAALIGAAVGTAPPVGALDITLYRDDLTTVGPQPVLKGTAIPVSIDGRMVLLVDDVLFTGRTIRAALDELIDFGRPERIRLAVLVDRGHRELPIRADHVGRTITTDREEVVQVMLEEEDGEDRVVLLERLPARPARARARREKRPARRRRA
ncbi:MAG TPA: bifunctional pyr operon transcriptional regulator/uracil phosphoribosyltransferase PyrR [Vicinamibacteria bacterium]|jgi:pyrimidine operon attenuation protein/uracil phosphoribosyltransferase|nr:bifunctional pyr operon transcriptional regulator/uracil phosphoribosyltransferase PyrR [Vicinamibacteria bacterium]